MMQSASRWSTRAASVAVLALTACGSTTDSLGDTRLPEITLHPLVGPSTYPNVFHDLLGIPQADITKKVNDAFAQLFHGDASNAAIFSTVDPDLGVITDVLHGQVRTEGLGYGMLIAVELDKQPEFDRLWRYAIKNRLTSGPNIGYFPSFCDISLTSSVSCADPFGLEQFTMALLLAHDRWSALSSTTIDYGAAAIDLLNLMRYSELTSGSSATMVASTFDPTAHLIFNQPTLPPTSSDTRPSLAMPAYYDLWQQATGDSFWGDAAAAARS
jgi:oligosaccharide reducing-end xylanase